MWNYNKFLENGKLKEADAAVWSMCQHGTDMARRIPGPGEGRCIQGWSEVRGRKQGIGWKAVGGTDHSFALSQTTQAKIRGSFLHNCTNGRTGMAAWVLTDFFWNSVASCGKTLFLKLSSGWMSILRVILYFVAKFFPWLNIGFCFSSLNRIDEFSPPGYSQKLPLNSQKRWLIKIYIIASSDSF